MPDGRRTRAARGKTAGNDEPSPPRLPAGPAGTPPVTEPIPGTRRVPFTVELRQPVLGVTVRTGWLIEGEAGWAEWSPLPSWNRQEILAAYRGALEAAGHAFPTARRRRVEVNAMVPRVPADTAARMAVASGCGTVKVKVGDPGGEARVDAVREAVGPSVRIRLDANGTWDVEEAQRCLARFASRGIELVEDPVPTLGEMAVLRRRSPVPVAVEMSIRTVDDVHDLRRLEAADVLVIKPQRLGGIGASLHAAELAHLPVIVSSALETSVGLSTCLAVAAALPETPYAHGIGTALLLSEDVSGDPLLPVEGWLVPRRVSPDLVLARP
jgi:O-succinylbenzoate synthase